MLRSKGHDPVKLPVAKSGQSGVKAQIRNALGSTGIWSGGTVFEKAWQRLRQTGAIADAK